MYILKINNYLMYLLADVGGTKTRIAVSKDLNEFSDPLVFKSGNINEFIKMTEEYTDLKQITHLVLGVTGTLNQNKSELIISPHLKSWEKLDLLTTFQKQTGIKNIYIENDTALVGLGESIFGAGKDYNLVSYVTISTGIGGVKIVNKKIEDTLYGFEPGHHIIDIKDGECVTWEEYASGSGILKRTGKEPIEIKDNDFWIDVHRKLSIGLYNISLLWPTECIIVGGGLINSKLINIDLLNDYFSTLYLARYKLKPQLLNASLIDYGGLWGGLALLRNKINLTN